MAPDQDTLKTPGQILRKALEMETQARDFYAVIANSCRIGFVRELLEKLQNEEYRHMSLVQDMIRRLESGKDLV